MRTLDVISDAICPWCWIGKAHLDAALEELRGEGLDFRVRWRPFQLNPDMPEEGVERDAYRAAKFGSLERSRELDAQVAEAGRAAGLDFRHDLMRRTPNTVAAHRVIRAAEEAGVQQPVVDALFRAYFQDGRDIGDPAALDGIAAAAGLPGMEAMLAGDAHRDAVLAEDMAARRGGISGVPSFLMDRHLLFSGAMPGPRMAEAFRQANAILSAREAAA
ncbi:DsbA family oxidoreductase [Falsiroseomonas oryzae]|uniref:DsbA family oxidoreductase n=1 Tax=Falsiroseomonas oryzae TaxID=2766473 RepID=UPI0022EB1C25|nr:DsbA family oxidoreductase [Roseomonas sp. MO-31]